jgi:hypothetical protein
MEEIKEKPETDNMETDQSEDAKSSAAHEFQHHFDNLKNLTMFTAFVS